MNEGNRLFCGCGIVVQGGKQILANLFFCGDFCHALPILDIKKPRRGEAINILWGSYCVALTV